MKTVSLFSGIGGFEAGLKDSYLDTEVVFSSEIDMHARKSYGSIWGIEPHGDITQISASDIPKHDLLVAGFPCQSFSIAGKRRGFEDTRGTLFFEVARIADYHNPKWIVLENVKNLISHNDGETFIRMIEVLSSIGYEVDFDVLNSKNFRTAQSRERVYIVARYADKHKSESYVINDISSLKIRSLKKQLNKKKEFKKFNFFEKIHFAKEVKTLRKIVDIKLADEYYYIKYPRKEIVKEEKEDVNEIIKLKTVSKEVIRDNDRQRRIYSIYGVSPTLLARADAPKIQINGKVRKLSEIEALRVQGFKESQIQKIVKSGVSRTQIYKQAGNAVSPNVIKELANIIHFFEQENQFKFIDLFSGIGGFRIAGEINGMKCVMSSEIDVAAKEQYFRNFNEYPNGDIQNIDAKSIPDHDLLLAGFPCQPFSIGGQRKGFDDTRGTLFFDVERILLEKQPKAFLLENVGGILSHDKGNTIRVIREKLNTMYNTFELRANAKDFGIPQNRDRWYIVGFHKKQSINEFEFPPKCKLRTKMTDYIAFDDSEELQISLIAKNNIDLNLIDKNEKYIIANGIRPSKCSFSDGEVSPCLTAKMGTGGNNVPVIINQNRKLSTRECLDLMGFPDNIEVPNTQNGYKQIGNSIVVPLVVKIISRIVKKIREEHD